ncbi:MAG: NAD(P)-dependent oxidoreductase [Candidatus Acidiferrales bacterium]
MATSVALLGLGLMGRPMAQNLLTKNFLLTVWNRTAARADALVEAGAQRAATPREAAAQADVVITMVSDPPALESVLWGNDGVLAGLKPGSVLIDSSTVSPELARRAAAACAERGCEFLDAPVTGGTWGAEKGELVFMAGGKAEVLERVAPVLGAMGKQWFYLGPHGSGQVIKLATNLILALQVTAVAEALALVRAAGVPGEKLAEVMQASMGRSKLIDVKLPMMLASNYTPSFPLRLMNKDVGLALLLAAESGLKLPGAEAAREVMDAVQQSIKEDVDYAALAKYWEKS